MSYPRYGRSAGKVRLRPTPDGDRDRVLWPASAPLRPYWLPSVIASYPISFFIGPPASVAVSGNHPAYVLWPGQARPHRPPDGGLEHIAQIAAPTLREPGTNTSVGFPAAGPCLGQGTHHACPGHRSPAPSRRPVPSCCSGIATAEVAVFSHPRGGAHPRLLLRDKGRHCQPPRPHRPAPLPGARQPDPVPGCPSSPSPSAERLLPDPLDMDACGRPRTTLRGVVNRHALAPPHQAPVS